MYHDNLVEIFFLITGAAVIVITVLLAVIILYIISIARTIRRIVRTAEFAAEMVKDDISDLRDAIKTHGLTLGTLTGIFKGFSRRHATIKRKK